jgi:hypothetical protein
MSLRIPAGALLAMTLVACAPSREAVTTARRAAEDEQRIAAAEIQQKLREMDRRMQRLRALEHRQDHRVATELRELEAMQKTLRLQAEEAQRSGRRTLREVEAAVDRTMDRIEKALGASS